jgi:hypothetical protein
VPEVFVVVAETAWPKATVILLVALAVAAAVMTNVVAFVMELTLVPDGIPGPTMN